MISGKNGPYDNIKSHKKRASLSLSLSLSQENTVLEKQQGWERVKLSPLAFLRLKLLHNQKANYENNDNPCLHYLPHNLKKWDFAFIIRIIIFSDSIFKENLSN